MMKKPFGRRVAAALLLGSIVASAVAEPIPITGFADGSDRRDLVEYDLDGLKLDTHTDIALSDIAGPTVLERAQGRFARIRLKGKEIWVRLDRFRLASAGELQDCPDTLPSESPDRTVPGTSGVSPECEESATR